MLSIVVLFIACLLLPAAVFIISRIKESPGSAGENLTVSRLRKTVTKFALNDSFPPGQVNSLPKTLTSREKEAVMLLLTGLRRSEIASALDISLNTLNSHCKKYTKKPGCDSQASLMSRYIIHSATSLR